MSLIFSWRILNCGVKLKRRRDVQVRNEVGVRRIQVAFFVIVVQLSFAVLWTQVREYYEAGKSRLQNRRVPYC